VKGDQRTEERHVLADPQRRQHLLRFRLFTNKQNRRTDEQRSHVGVKAAFQERQNYLGGGQDSR